MCSNLALFVLKFLLTLLKDLIYHYIWFRQSGAFLVHMNFSFVDFKALLSLRFTFISICDKKMMIIDAFFLTNPAFIIFICSEGLFRGNQKKAVLKCSVYCFTVFKIGSESLIDH